MPSKEIGQLEKCSWRGGAVLIGFVWEMSIFLFIKFPYRELKAQDKHARPRLEPGLADRAGGETTP